MSPSLIHKTLTLGQSVLGKTLQAQWFYPESRAKEPVDLLIMGAFHGDEAPSAVMAERICLWLPKQADFQGFSTLVWPVVNPDGLAQNTRTNANGVDLNRNFPANNWEKGNLYQQDGLPNPYYGGSAPAGELETQAVLDLIAHYRPRCIVSYHTPYEIINWDGPQTLVLPWAAAMATAMGYPVQADIGYPTPGSFGSWCVERDIAVLTVELGENESPESLWQRTEAGLLALAKVLA